MSFLVVDDSGVNSLYSDFGQMWFQQNPYTMARFSVPQGLRTSPSEISNVWVQCHFATAQLLSSVLP